MKNTFQPPFWKKIRKLPMKPSATVAVAVGLKSLATAVELRPSSNTVDFIISCRCACCASH